MTRVISLYYKTGDGNRRTETYLLAKITEESKIICHALMGLQFLWKGGEDATRDGDVTRDNINIGKSTFYESTVEKLLSDRAGCPLKRLRYQVRFRSPN